MYSLPNGYKGRLVSLFKADEKYDGSSFFANDGVKVVDSAFGKYIETSDEPLSRFGYRFKIDNKDKPHMLVVLYPDDKRRYMMINDTFSYDLSCGVFTGEEYPVTNTVKRIEKIFHTRTEDQTITFLSWGKGEPAAIFGFAVYELQEIPERDIKRPVGIPTRHYGVQYEDPCGALSDLGALTISEWTERYIEFAKHTGLNILVQPINWYAGPTYDSEVQPPSAQYWVSLENHDQYTVITSKPYDWLSSLIDECGKADIDFVGGMTLIRLGKLMKNMNIDITSIRNGKDTYNNMRADNMVQTSTNDWTRIYNALNYEKMIAENRAPSNYEGFELVYGEKRDSFGGAPMFNPLHPEVQRQISEYLEEISKRFGNKKAFRGVSINVWHATMVWFSSLKIGYDDYTISLFEAETGIKIPCESTDPERFGKRFNYLTTRNRALWIEWRCKKIRELILKMRDSLKKYNPALNLYLCLWNEPVKRTMYGKFDESMQYPAFLSENEFLREGGIDMALFEKDEGVYFSVEQNQQRDRGCADTVDGAELSAEQKRYFHDLAYIDSSWIDGEKTNNKNGAFVFDSWVEGWGDYCKSPFNIHTPEIDEVIRKSGFDFTAFFKDTCKLKSDGYWFESQRQITSCYPAGANYMEPLAHAVAELDPLYLFRGGLYLDQSHIFEMQSYAGAFSTLPAVKFDSVAGKNDPITVREKTVGGVHYFYAVNREPYEVFVRVYLSSPARCFEIYDNSEVTSFKNEVSFVLPPFSMRSFFSEGENSICKFSPTLPEWVFDQAKERYEYQMKVFDWARENTAGVYGMFEIEERLKTAFCEFSPSKIRHLLNSYVCVKTRELYEKR